LPLEYPDLDLVAAIRLALIGCGVAA